MKQSTWKKVDDKTKKLAPLLILLLTIYLYSSFVNPILPKTVKKYLGLFLIVYFVVELVIKYLAVRDSRKFMKKYWFDIILLVPFFKSLRILGMAGKSLKMLKYIPYARKAVKVPKILVKYFNMEEDSKD